MQDYIGRWNTIKEFINNDTNYLNLFNQNTLETLANPTLSNSPINGSTEILPNSIPGSAMQAGSITSRELGTLVTLPTLANNTYFVAANSVSGTDNLIKANASDNLQHGILWEALQLNNNKVLGGTTTGAALQSWMKTNSSNNWQFLSDAYTNNMYPNTDNTYAQGKSSAVYAPSYYQNIYLKDYGTSNKFYRSGTWTPTVQGGSTTGTASYSTQSGNYYVIGPICFVTFTVTWTSHTGTGALQVVTLPFVSNSSAICTGSIPFMANTTLANAATFMEVSNASSILQFAVNVTGAGQTALAIAASGSISGSFFYIVA